MAQSWEQAAAAALGRLKEPHLAKKKATILALVDARLSGLSEESVWKRPDTCSRTVYWTKWSKDPVFAGVLAEVTRLAQEWQDSRSMRALAEAQERLRLASPLAAGAVIKRLQSTDEKIVLRAAFGILDRAGMETAVKGSTEHSLSADQFAALREEARRQAEEEEEAALGEWAQQGPPDEGEDEGGE